MKLLYPQIWKGLRLIEGLEKTAGVDTLTPAIASELFERVKRAALSRSEAGDTGVKVAALMVEMRQAHVSCGEKLAGDVTVHGDMIVKLATACFVDDVLEEQCSKLAGEELTRARAVQSLGREYAVHLMNGLLA